MGENDERKRVSEFVRIPLGLVGAVALGGLLARAADVATWIPVVALVAIYLAVVVADHAVREPV